MKKYILFILVMSVFASCEPIIDRDELPAPLTAAQINEQIQISVTATVADGNQLVLSNKSPFAGKWEHPLGVSLRKNDTIIVLPGKHKIQFTATTGGGLVVIEKEIEVKNITHDLASPLAELIGKKGEGVDWVYATDHPSGNYWGMVAPEDWTEFWWMPDDSGSDFENEFRFAYENGFVFTQDGVKGTFKFLSGSMLMTLTNPHLHLYDVDQGQGEAVMNAGVFQVKVLNENELVLVQKYPVDLGYDWMWRFKRKGYEYPAAEE